MVKHRGRRVGVWTVLVAAGWFAAGCFERDSPIERLAAGELMGRVVTGALAQPVEAAIVGRAGTKGVATGADGTFVLKQVPAGTADLLARAKVGDVWWYALRRATPVSATDAFDVGDLVLRPPGTLSGVVRAADTPLPGAIVVDMTTGRWTVADAAGAYHLEDLPQGAHELRTAVRDAGGTLWMRPSEEITVGLSTTHDVQPNPVAAGSETAVLRFGFPPGAQLAGLGSALGLDNRCRVRIESLLDAIRPIDVSCQSVADHDVTVPAGVYRLEVSGLLGPSQERDPILPHARVIVARWNEGNTATRIDVGWDEALPPQGDRPSTPVMPCGGPCGAEGSCHDGAYCQAGLCVQPGFSCRTASGAIIDARSSAMEVAGTVDAVRILETGVAPSAYPVTLQLWRGGSGTSSATVPASGTFRTTGSIWQFPFGPLAPYQLEIFEESSESPVWGRGPTAPAYRRVLVGDGRETPAAAVGQVLPVAIDAPWAAGDALESFSIGANLQPERLAVAAASATLSADLSLFRPRPTSTWRVLPLLDAARGDVLWLTRLAAAGPCQKISHALATQPASLTTRFAAALAPVGGAVAAPVVLTRFASGAQAEVGAAARWTFDVLALPGGTDHGWFPFAPTLTHCEGTGALAPPAAASSYANPYPVHFGVIGRAIHMAPDQRVRATITAPIAFFATDPVLPGGPVRNIAVSSSGRVTWSPPLRGTPDHYRVRTGGGVPFLAWDEYEVPGNVTSVDVSKGIPPSAYQVMVETFYTPAGTLPEISVSAISEVQP